MAGGDPLVCSCILREIGAAGTRVCAAYPAGAAHDGTFSSLHGTIRISQVIPAWLRILQAVFHRLRSRIWIYREGARRVWVVESTYKISNPLDAATPDEMRAYVRGYFDAEGGLPQRADRRLYIQIAQEDRQDLQQVWGYLERLGVRCGRIHNPSVRVDPGYWRFYVRVFSHPAFIDRVGSWHPHKRRMLAARGAAGRTTER